MHVRENKQAQLLPHIHCIHGKVVFQLGYWDKPVQLKPVSTETFIIWCVCIFLSFYVLFLFSLFWPKASPRLSRPICGRSLASLLRRSLTFLSIISLPCEASELPYAMARLDMGSDRMDWPGNPAAGGPVCMLLLTCHKDMFQLEEVWRCVG